MASFTNCTKLSKEYAKTLNSLEIAILSAYLHVAEKFSNLQSMRTAYLRKTMKDYLNRKRLKAKFKKKILENKLAMKKMMKVTKKARLSKSC